MSVNHEETSRAIGLPPVPTTKILAIGTLADDFTLEKRRLLMPKEVRATVSLYLGAKIDQFWSRQDFKGVVFLMNVTATEEAHELLESLPLGVAGMMSFELIPLGPLRPLHQLLAVPE